MLIARRKPRSKLVPVKGVDPLHCKNGGILSAINRFESEINATIMQVSDTPTEYNNLGWYTYIWPGCLPAVIGPFPLTELHTF